MTLRCCDLKNQSEVITGTSPQQTVLVTAGLLGEKMHLLPLFAALQVSSVCFLLVTAFALSSEAWMFGEDPAGAWTQQDQNGLANSTVLSSAPVVSSFFLSVLSRSHLLPTSLAKFQPG